MKVSTLMLSATFVVIDKDGKKTEAHDQLIQGCYEMCQYLKKSYGIDTVPSTVWAAKKEFTPNMFPYGRTKEYYMAYLNWRLNYPRDQRAEFFEDDDMDKFAQNNPIADVLIRVKK